MLVSATGNPFLLPRRRGIMSVRTNKSKPDKSDNKARDTLLQGLRGHVPERGAGKPRQPQPGRFALRNAGILPATSGGILAASVGSIVKVDALKTLLCCRPGKALRRRFAFAARNRRNASSPETSC